MVDNEEKPSKFKWVSGKFLETAFYVLLFFSAVTILGQTIADNDLWGHIKFGADFIKAGAILKEDPYSYLTIGTPWMDHEWLSEIIFAYAYQLGGVQGISLLRVGLVSLILLIIILAFKRNRLPIVLQGAFLSVILLQLSAGLGTLRPQLFTYLIFALELVLLQAATINEKRALLWFLPLLFMLWINLHGGILAGLIILLFWAGLQILNKTEIKEGKILFDFKKYWIWLLVPLLCLLSTCVTPYGASMLPFLLMTATVPRPEIMEWHSIAGQLSNVDGVCYVISALFAGFISWRLMWQREPVPMLVMLACTVLPLLATRHLPLCVMAISILSLPSLSALVTPKWSEWRVFWVNHELAILRVALAGLIFFGTASMIAASAPKQCRIPAGEFMPVRAVTLLKLSGVKANLACFFDWGEYCIWHLGPDIKVSIDGRRETVYNEKAYQKNVEFINGHPENWHKLVSTERTDLVLAHKQTNCYQILKNDPHVELIFEDDGSALFAPTGSPYSAKIIEAAKQMPPPAKEQVFP